MVVGAGIDIENHNRFIKYYKSDEFSKFLGSIFSEKELKNYSLYNSHLCYALSFSCKESFFKAFSFTKDNINISPKEIELIFNEFPEKKNASVFFSGEAEKIIKLNNVKFPPFFEYNIFENLIVFESILSCKK